MPLAQKNSQIPDNLKKQIAYNFRKDESQPSQPPAEPLQSSAEPKSKYADVVNIRLTSGKRSEFKTFFSQCEISMNQGFEAAVDYLIREVRAGHIKLSKSGITEHQD